MASTGNDLSNSILGITLVSAPVSILHTIGTVLLWYGFAMSSTVVKALLRLLLFMLSTSCDPRNISSSIQSELFFCLLVLYFVHLLPFLANFAKMTAFMAIMALNTASWTLFVARVGLIAASVA